MMAASNIQYEVAGRDRGLACGGIGVMHLLARRTGLIRAINDKAAFAQGASAVPRVGTMC